MSLLDKIKSENQQPSTIVPLRPDPVLDEALSEHSPAQSSTEQGQNDPIAALEHRLATFPKVSQKKLGIRLEEDLMIQIQSFCHEYNITPETLFESLFITTLQQEIMKQTIIEEAQKRIKKRVKAGNIRSAITKMKNLNL